MVVLTTGLLSSVTCDSVVRTTGHTVGPERRPCLSESAWIVRIFRPPRGADRTDGLRRSGGLAKLPPWKLRSHLAERLAVALGREPGCAAECLRKMALAGEAQHLGQPGYGRAAAGEQLPSRPDPLAQQVLVWGRADRVAEEQREVMRAQLDHAGQRRERKPTPQVGADVFLHDGELLCGQPARLRPGSRCID